MSDNRIIKSDSDLFGDKVIGEAPTREKYIEPPFSVLDTKTASWKKRKNAWARLGIKSEVGRNANLFAATNKSFANASYGRTKENEMANESIFDPALCEILYNWYCPSGGHILDPFAGGSVRGIVANYLGYKYTGIDIRPEQIESNIQQGLDILGLGNMPEWIVGDSNKVLEEIAYSHFSSGWDLIFSCPPYADLEVYSDIEGDISNKKYPEFIRLYNSIIGKSCELLKPGGHAIFVVGEVRAKSGELLNFVSDTISCFRNAGLVYYNEAILLNQVGTAMLRANNIFERGKGKLVKLHQNILIFKKPEEEYSL